MPRAPAPKPLPAPDLPARLAQGVPQVVVLAGAEPWFREDGLARIVARVLPDGDCGGAFQRHDARRPEDREGVSAAIDEVRTRSLFGGGKVIAIDNAESASGPWAAVGRTSPMTVLARAALASPQPERVLVLLTSRPVKGKGAAPVASLAKAGALVVDCRALYDTPGAWRRGVPPYENELARFLSRRMRELYDKRLDLLAAHALAQ
ncbi:MAG: hypothetical protein ACC662_02290, partial [Planctomycetota bacterium]